MLRLCTSAVLLAAAALLAAGCGRSDFPNAFPTTLEEVDRIVDDEDLTAQEKREALEELGITPSVINALLADERTGNQFGGDLSSAHDKVSGGRFSELTPDEVQLFADAAREIEDGPNFDLEDAEAQAIVTFFVENGVNTADELEAVLDNQGIELPDEAPEGVFQELFIDFDPNQVLPQIP